jgi:hypothetical protein
VVVRIALVLCCVVVLVVLASLVAFPLIGKRAPRAAPADPCALVPAEVLALVVPAAGPPKARVRNGQPYANEADCTVKTDPGRAPTDATGNLSVSIERDGSRGAERPAGHAQTDFAVRKRQEQEGRLVKRRVSDLAGLGESAYLSADVPGEPAGGSATARVMVLSGDTIATVTYSASPSDDRLVAAAAVRVARELMKAAR